MPLACTPPRLMRQRSRTTVLWTSKAPRFRIRRRRTRRSCRGLRGRQRGKTRGRVSRRMASSGLSRSRRACGAAYGQGWTGAWGSLEGTGRPQVRRFMNPSPLVLFPSRAGEGFAAWCALHCFPFSALCRRGGRYAGLQFCYRVEGQVLLGRLRYLMRPGAGRVWEGFPGARRDWGGQHRRPNVHNLQRKRPFCTVCTVRAGLARSAWW